MLMVLFAAAFPLLLHCSSCCCCPLHKRHSFQHLLLWLLLGTVAAAAVCMQPAAAAFVFYSFSNFSGLVAGVLWAAAAGRCCCFLGYTSPKQLGVLLLQKKGCINPDMIWTASQSNMCSK
jgi:hypothetical protein